VRVGGSGGFGLMSFLQNQLVLVLRVACCVLRVVWFVTRDACCTIACFMFNILCYVLWCVLSVGVRARVAIELVMCA
jgi:hypothetical protein